MARRPEERLTVGLVACAATKAGTHQPARLLYRSELFRRASAYAAVAYDHWFILSARHYLVHPDEDLDPYDQTLARMTVDGRAHWGAIVEQDLRLGHGALTEGRRTWPVTTPRLLLGKWVMDGERAGIDRRVDVWFHAGADYVTPVRARLSPHFVAHTPLEGLGIGRQLRWYAQHSGPQTALF